MRRQHWEPEDDGTVRRVPWTARCIKLRMIGVTNPAQCLFTLWRYTDAQPTPPKSSVRSLAKRRDRPVLKSRTLTTATQPEQQPQFPMVWNSTVDRHLHCRRRWDMESHSVPAVGFTPPVDSSDEAKPTTRRPREPVANPKILFWGVKT